MSEQVQFSQQANNCIYKKGSCPDGLNDGFVYWDDDDKRETGERLVYY